MTETEFVKGLHANQRKIYWRLKQDAKREIVEPTIKVLGIIARSIGSDHAAKMAKDELERLQRL